MVGFAKKVLTLTAGNFIAQLISIGLMPVITRLYAPEHFGVYSFYLSIVMVIFPVSTLRFNSAIMLPDDDTDAAGLLILSWLSVLFVALLVMPALLWVLMLIGWHGGVLGGLVWIVCAGVLIQGAFQAANFWALRCGKFKTMSTAVIASSVVDRGMVIVAAIAAGTTPLGLILGRIFGPLVSLLIVTANVVIPSSNAIKGAARVDILKRLARRYKDFPVFSSWSFLFSALSREAPTILLAMLYSPTTAGFYALGMRVMNMPMMLIGDAVAKVFLQVATRAGDKRDDVERTARHLMLYAIMATLPFSVAIVTFGEEIFTFFFGQDWSKAGTIAQILMGLFVVRFLYRIISVLLDVYEKQRQMLRIDLALLFFGSLPLVTVAAVGGSDVEALAILAISTMCVYVAAIGYILGLVYLDYVKLVRSLVVYGIVSLPFIAFMVALPTAFSLGGLQLMGAIAGAVALQYVLVVLMDAKLRMTARKLLKV